jgi:hypothetical protein
MASSRPILVVHCYLADLSTTNHQITAKMTTKLSREGACVVHYERAKLYFHSSQLSTLVNYTHLICPTLMLTFKLLDRIPVYHLQHSIRLLVVRKCETTLSWDQLRSPQISQFLVKPIQLEIRSAHSNKATLYALLANCLQFQKDGQLNPGTVGVSSTRSLICELLAMRVLRDYSTREVSSIWMFLGYSLLIIQQLIDALFYDFDPLQGLPARSGIITPGFNRVKHSTRTSTVEIAIRAHAKRFLSHPLVVQQLEAVWAGTIVFHSSADTLHRQPKSQKPSLVASGYGAVGGPIQFRTISYADAPRKGKAPATTTELITRRAVSLYDPSDASLFKLSRLRVPRYRQLFSTLSYAVMLGLFLAVLIVRSRHITALELIFWFWSAGYMLDEVVGFSEQGFGLYIISVWNSFDIGILLMFITYYILRLYSIIIPTDEDHWIVSLSYDVLAATAVLLFPRLFSVLDHYRYFSQLLIAFRMMAVDLAAILILIVIACSGFFAAFTLSFSGKDFNSSGAAYVLFQILMGFTPAAWEIWDDYNILGKAILVIFLIICHFLIVTILITVLTNSFMAIVQNANEEHQFLFAVNTISMVKSDALFSYIPPTNIIGWLLSPFRFMMPFRRYIRFNRTIIKATHLPILLFIFLYERLILSRRIFEPTDLVEQRGREQTRIPGFSVRGPGDLFSPGARLREPSVATFHKDQALEEVFRRPVQSIKIPQDSELKRKESMSRSKSKTVVQDWMRSVGREGGAGSPLSESQDILDHLEGRKPMLRRHKTHTGTSRFAPGIRSAASDPEEHPGEIGGFHYFRPEDQYAEMSPSDLVHHTDEDGDDELATNDDEDAGTQDHSLDDIDERFSTSNKENKSHLLTPRPKLYRTRKPLSSLQGSAIISSASDGDEGDPITPIATRTGPLRGGSDDDAQLKASPEQPATAQRVPPSKKDRGQHIRTASSATILFAPLDNEPSSSKTPLSSSPAQTRAARSSARNSGIGSTLVATPSGSGTPYHHSSYRHSHYLPATASASALPVSHEGDANDDDTFGPLLYTGPSAATTTAAAAIARGNKSAPNLSRFLRGTRRQPSFNAMALDLASDLGDNRAAPLVDAGLLSTSFDTQWERLAVRRARPSRRGLVVDDEDDDEDEYDDEDRLSGVMMSGGHGRRSGGGGGQTRRLNRLMLARMTHLEEGFREVLKEVKSLSSVSRGPNSVAGSEPGGGMVNSLEDNSVQAAGRSSV